MSLKIIMCFSEDVEFDIFNGVIPTSDDTCESDLVLRHSVYKF